MENQYLYERIKDAEKDYSYIEKQLSFANKIVLEIGCGTGGKCFFFHQLGASKVIGIDISPRVVETQAIVRHWGAESIHFVLADGSFPPFPANSFDLIVLHDTMEHLANPSILIRECARLLRPSGNISVITPHYLGLSGNHLWNYLDGRFWRYSHFHLLLPRKILHSLIQVIGYLRGYPQQQIDEEWHQFITLNQLRQHELIDLLSVFFTLNYIHIRRANLPLGPFWKSSVVSELFSYGIVAVGTSLKEGDSD